MPPSGDSLGPQVPAEEAIRLAHFAVDHAANAVFWLSSNGAITYVNQAACQALGYTRPELLSMRVFDIDPQFTPEIWPQHWETLKRDGTITLESQHKTKEGKIIPVEIVANYWAFGDREYNVAFAHDTTDRTVANRALRESEENYQVLFENAPVGLGVADANGRLIAFNQAMLEAGGYTREDVLSIGNVADLYYDADDRQHVLDAAKRDGFVRDFPVRFKRKDGSPYEALLSLRPVALEEGPGWLSMVQDITDRKRNQLRDLHEEGLLRERHTALVSLATGDAVRGPDLLSALREATVTAARTLGVERVSVWLFDAKREKITCADLYELSSDRHTSGAELIAKNYPAYFEALEADRVIAANDAHTDPRTAEFSEGYLAPLGISSMLDAPLRVGGRTAGMVCHEHVGEARVWTVEDQGFAGSVADLVSLALESNERKLAEEALRRSEASYRGLFEHATYGIYRSSLDGRFLTVNRALVEMLGYESVDELEAVDMARDVYLDAEERERLIEKHDAVELFRDEEVQWKRKDGQPIRVRLSGRPVRIEDGDVECFEMSVEDVTERHGLEAQLRQAQKMEAIGQLTGGIAHDFNNLLSVILLNVQAVGSALEAGEPVERSDVRDMEQAAERAATVTRQLLGFSRHADLKPRPTDLASLVTGLRSMLRRVIPEHIEVRIASEERVRSVAVDPQSIEQILLNLATNARDAMPEGGTLRIGVEEALLNDPPREGLPWAEPGEYVCLEMTDTGIGMDEETQARIFEPFFTTKPPDAGTGLGLAMVYGLTKQQSGFVDVVSAVGKGTTFRFHFPVVEEEAWALETRLSADHIRGGKETILVVEDEDALRRTARRVLERYGYEVLLAANGKEALEVWRAEKDRIALIVSDVVMPRMGGLQLYAALRNEPDAPRFILTSGYAARDMLNRESLDPSVPLIEKPWNLTDLLVRVRRVLDNKW